MQMPATEGGLGTKAPDRRHPVRHAGPGCRSARVAARRRRRDQGQRRYLPPARGVAGLTADRDRLTPMASTAGRRPSISRFAGSASPSGRPAPSTMSRSPSGPARSTRFVGENGAGKSTLGKIIAGVFPQDQGDLVLRGTTVSFGSPREALVRGIALVAQEVALVPRLTVAQNVFLGAEPRRAGFIDRGSLRERFDRLVADAGFDLEADTIVGRLPLAAAAAGGDPPRARARGGPDRPRRAVGEPVGDGDRATARGRPRRCGRGAGRSSSSRISWPRSSSCPTPSRSCATAASSGRPRPPTRPRAASSPGCSAGRSAGPTRTSGRRRRTPRRLAVEGLSAPGRRRCHADPPGRRDRRAGRARRRRPLRAGPGDLRRDPGDGRRRPASRARPWPAGRPRRSTRASR